MVPDSGLLNVQMKGLLLGPESQLISTTRGINTALHLQYLFVKKIKKKRERDIEEKNKTAEGTTLINRILKLLRGADLWWWGWWSWLCCPDTALHLRNFLSLVEFQQSEIFYKHVSSSPGQLSKGTAWGFKDCVLHSPEIVVESRNSDADMRLGQNICKVLTVHQGGMTCRLSFWHAFFLRVF